ncbi:MAG: hypothetical protein K2K46_00020 [Lachnospiraceae bacterium]|nr:hypothetical protein [Lachnospiraceae bacterium]
MEEHTIETPDLEENPDEINEEDAESFEYAESDAAEAPETVSGNNADYPYGSITDASPHAAYETDETGSLLLIEAMERQNDILYAGFMSTLFILGVILGVLVMHGFRLRRV